MEPMFEIVQMGTLSKQSGKLSDLVQISLASAILSYKIELSRKKIEEINEQIWFQMFKIVQMGTLCTQSEEFRPYQQSLASELRSSPRYQTKHCACWVSPHTIHHIPCTIYYSLDMQGRRTSLLYMCMISIFLAVTVARP
jgi:hypothetical protein